MKHGAPAQEVAQLQSGLEASYRSQVRALQRAQREAEQAMRAQIRQAARSLEAQIPTVNQTYDDIAKQVYAQYRQQQIKLPAQASGLATGTADSLAQKGRLSYEDTQAQTQQSRAQALSGIQSDIARIEETGDLQLAQNAERYAQAAEQLKQQLAQQAYEQLLAARQTQQEGLSPESAQSVLARLLEQLAGLYTNPGPSQETTAATVTNPNGSGWVYVGGIGRITYAELLALVKAGQVVETESNGVYTYRRA